MRANNSHMRYLVTEAKFRHKDRERRQGIYEFYMTTIDKPKAKTLRDLGERLTDLKWASF